MSQLHWTRQDFGIDGAVAYEARSEDGVSFHVFNQGPVGTPGHLRWMGDAVLLPGNEFQHEIDLSDHRTHPGEIQRLFQEWNDKRIEDQRAEFAALRARLIEHDRQKWHKVAPYEEGDLG